MYALVYYILQYHICCHSKHVRYIQIRAWKIEITKDFNFNLGHELQVNDEPTIVNMVIQVLATGSMWIVDPNPIKVEEKWQICVHENTWLRKVSWDPFQWM